MLLMARRAFLVAALALAGLVGGTGAVASLEDHRCEVVPAPRAVSGEGLAKPLAVTWLGDTLLADAAQPWLDANGYAWPFAHLGELLEADHVIGNLEGPLTDRSEEYARRGRWSYNASPSAAAGLAEAGVTAVGLANNHAMDRGPDGLADTLGALAEEGLASAGAGPSEAAARAPLILAASSGSIAVVALGDHYGTARIAEGTQAGGAVYNPCAIVAAAADARQRGVVIVAAFVHWGSNYSEVQPGQRALARLFVDAGYDLVVGHGPHVTQPIEVIEGVPILYSLGNFVFGTPGRFSERFPGYGLVATTQFEGSQVSAIELRCILTDNDRVAFQPRPCPANEAARLLASLHADLEVTGGVGYLALPPR